MKQLDEMERKARGWTEEYQSSLPVGELSNELARALLAVMPVVRAAEALAGSNRHLLPLHLRPLADAVDELRRRLGGE